MRLALSILLLGAAFVVLFQGQTKAPTISSPVVVELFTSEGCSSCPPADALLAEMERSGQVHGAEIIALGVHVDYWDGPTWTDRFSTHEGSLRQADYAAQLHLPSPYTPQIVVDGHIDAIGNDRPSVFRAIAAASHDPKPAEVILVADPGVVHVTVRSAPPGSRVMLALTETNLSTQVRGGENGGRELHHAAVVRSLKSVGNTVAGPFSVTVPLVLAPDWKRADLRVIAFVQRQDGWIVGAATTHIDGGRAPE